MKSIFPISVIISFLAGFICCIVLLSILAYYIFFYSSQKYVEKAETKEAEKVSPLSLRGHIRISKELLSMADVMRRDTDNGSLPLTIDTKQPWIDKIADIYTKTTQFSGFLISRFLGDSSAVLDVAEEPIRPYQDVYAVLTHKTLYLYTDEEKMECVMVILIPQYQISLHPSTLTEHELFMPQNPIMLRVLEDTNTLNLEPIYYIYASTPLEKEDWFVILKRSSLLPAFADSGALTTFYEEVDTVKQYNDAMKKLVENTRPDYWSDYKANDRPTNSSDTAWLNALVGRMFVAIHSNPNVKEWVKNRLSRHTVESQDASVLGDIVIQELDVGNSLPVLTNPKLVNISVDGDMLIEMDIDYTGGVRLVLATETTLSVPAWDAYMKPITVPIVVAVKISRFSARILFKIKPFWESNRIWFGFYRKPELILELEVEPIISNKLIKIQIINQLIERRIKESLEAYVMLPNMDDLSFWDFSDLNGSPFGEDGSEESDADLESDTGTLKPKLIHSPASEPESLELDPTRNPAFNSAIVGEALESKFISQEVVSIRRRKSISRYIEDVEKHVHNFENPNTLSSPFHSETDRNSVLQIPADIPDCLDRVKSDTDKSQANSSTENQTLAIEPVSDSHSPTDTKPESIVEYLGTAAYNLGNFSRQYGLDKTAESLATSVVDYAKPAMKYAQEKTETYSQVVQNRAAIVGLSAIEKLGLSKNDGNISNMNAAASSDDTSSLAESSSGETSGRILRNKSSKTWSVLGISISTAAPAPTSTSSPITGRKKSKKKEAVISVVEPSSPSSDGAISLDSNDLESYSLFLDRSNNLKYAGTARDGQSTPRKNGSFS